MGIEFNQYITNITEYFSSITQNKPVAFVDPEEIYDAADLKSQMEAKEPHFSVVAAYELARSLERSHDMRKMTPKDYFQQWKDSQAGRVDHFNHTQANYDLTKRSTL